jgi:hypothetical protein
MRMPPALAAVAIALAFPASGFAGDDESGDDESVTRVSCVGGTAELRLEADDEEGEGDGEEDGEDDDEDDDERGDEIEIELRVRVPASVPTWRLVLLHERRLVYQGLRRSTRGGHALRYDREVPDWEGSQTVAARLATPSGRACRLEATI